MKLLNMLDICSFDINFSDVPILYVTLFRKKKEFKAKLSERVEQV